MQNHWRISHFKMWCIRSSTLVSNEWAKQMKYRWSYEVHIAAWNCNCIRMRSPFSSGVMKKPFYILQMCFLRMLVIRWKYSTLQTQPAEGGNHVMCTKIPWLWTHKLSLMYYNNYNCIILNILRASLVIVSMEKYSNNTPFSSVNLHCSATDDVTC